MINYVTDSLNKKERPVHKTFTWYDLGKVDCTVLPRQMESLFQELIS